MLILGILFIAGGILAVSFGVLQNTVLYGLFASTNAQLALQLDGIKQESPGTLLMIAGAIALAIGIILIIIRGIRKKGVSNGK